MTGVQTCALPILTLYDCASVVNSSNVIMNPINDETLPGGTKKGFSNFQNIILCHSSTTKRGVQTPPIIGIPESGGRMLDGYVHRLRIQRFGEIVKWIILFYLLYLEKITVSNIRSHC